MTVRADWIAVDWGTSRLRAYAMSAAGDVLDRAASGDGMGGLARDGFEPALFALIADWLGDGSNKAPTPVIAAGMVGAKQGWVEAPYLAAPCRPHGSDRFVRAPTSDPRLDVRIAPGVSQAKPPDVMRGEETQIAGYLATDPEFDGVLCLPGTHSKWVRVSAGEIVGFRTLMTGELFALIAERSVLRHSIGDGWDGDAFAEALSDGLSKPEMFAARLFALRAEDLLTGLDAGAARARLSGLLIGMELAATRPWWLGRNVALIGEDGLGARYQSALSAQGVSAPLASGDRMALAGLAAAYRAMETAE